MRWGSVGLLEEEFLRESILRLVRRRRRTGRSPRGRRHGSRGCGRRGSRREQVEGIGFSRCGSSDRSSRGRAFGEHERFLARSQVGARFSAGIEVEEPVAELPANRSGAVLQAPEHPFDGFRRGGVFAAEASCGGSGGHGRWWWSWCEEMTNIGRESTCRPGETTEQGKELSGDGAAAYRKTARPAPQLHRRLSLASSLQIHNTCA